jgi:hypothetical protein
MACVDVFQALKMATESLSKDIHRKATHKSVWMNALPKGTYPLGTGLKQTTFTVENSLPTDDQLPWETIGATGVSGDIDMDTTAGLCARTWNDVEWGFSEQEFSPERISIRGPQVCQSNLKYRHNVDSFLRAYLEEITKHSKRILENKVANEYMKKARQVTLAGTAADGSDAELVDTDVTSLDIDNHAVDNALVDTVPLLQHHLDQLAIKLIESGATEGDSNGWIELGPNGPIFPLVIGMDQSNQLLKGANVGEIRTDYRESSQANELLKAIGADRVVGNFRHIVVTNPPRFKRKDGPALAGYRRIDENVALAGGEITKGSGTKINPLYTSKSQASGNNGIYEAAVVLNPSVMRQLVVPSSTPGSLGFSPENYSGAWEFITGAYKWGGADTCEDPSEVFGRHIGMYEMAFEPIFGDHGATVLFKRPNLVA